MTGEIRDFNTVAKTWDENPDRVKLAADVAAAITDTIPLAPTMDVLDFGCGTGLLTLHIQPHVRSITGIDSSEGMLAILNEKIDYNKLQNVKSRHIDLDRGDHIPGRYHLIVSSMTLHHVKDIPQLLAHFFEALLPGGLIAIADLDPDGGKFHDDNTGIFHFGFEREAQKKAFLNAGFVLVQDRTAAIRTKPVPGGKAHTFTIALISGKKPA
ncbi:class I SAM-dependent methyltransferase [Methanoregula sp.]|uniref:class I SAM-dependent DNA methyltransferase n=1 Tax=Methanoregula sp. TaxID=2052170 RepID=UPI00356409AF